MLQTGMCHAISNKNFHGRTVSGRKLLAGACGAAAGGAVALTDRMLDRVTAGSAAALLSSTASQATGALAITSAGTQTVIAPGESPIRGQPDLGETMGVAQGSAVAFGTNHSQTGLPPTTSTTNVVTDGVADGNFVWKSAVKETFHGAGGVTAQIGWTVIYGGWLGF